MLLRTIVVTVAVLLPTTATALAAPPRDAPTPRQAGVRLTWPSRAQRVTLAPGATVRVTVRSLRRRSAPVTVTLLRTDGAKARVVKRRTLRRGSFSARLPQADGARYVLSARIGRRTHRRLTIVTAAPPRRDETPAPPAPPVAPPCAVTPSTSPTTSAATLTGDRSSLGPGERLTLMLANTGTACLTGGVGYAIDVRHGEVWEPSGLRLIFPAVAVTIAPGATRTVTFDGPEGIQLPPGRYRLSQQYSSVNGPVTVAWEFDYSWPAPGPHPDSCGVGNPRADVTLDRTTAANGEQLVMTVTNSGSLCLIGSETGFHVHRELPGGGLEQIFGVAPDLPYRKIRFQPGESRSFTIPVLDAARMPPGRYRVVYDLSVPTNSDAIQMVLAIAEFEVVAPPD